VTSKAKRFQILKKGEAMNVKKTSTIALCVAFLMIGNSLGSKKRKMPLKRRMMSERAANIAMNSIEGKGGWLTSLKEIAKEKNIDAGTYIEALALYEKVSTELEKVETHLDFHLPIKIKNEIVERIKSFHTKAFIALNGIYNVWVEAGMPGEINVSAIKKKVARRVRKYVDDAAEKVKRLKKVIDEEKIEKVKEDWDTLFKNLM